MHPNNNNTKVFYIIKIGGFIIELTAKQLRYKKSNDKKAELLNMPFGTASNRMKKNLMFYLVQLCGMDNCYRCGELIETSEELSVEHKESWQLSDNPVEKFFGIANLAFSHLKCNLGHKDLREAVG